MKRMKLKLKEVRKSKGLSINDVATKAKISPQYVVKLEADDRANPGMKVLGSLCYALECEPNDLLTLEDVEE